METFKERICSYFTSNLDFFFFLFLYLSPTLELEMTSLTLGVLSNRGVKSHTSG